MPQPDRDAFYVADGDRFLPTDLTRGPWDPKAQHAGPPAALVARAIERLEPPGMQVARFTLEVLRPLPLTPLDVATRVVRAGRRVQFVEAVLRADDREVARASAWRIMAVASGAPETALEPTPLPPPEKVTSTPVPPLWDGESYFTAIEWRFARGEFYRPGPSAAWMRMRVPLVAGEPVSPLSRVLVVADSGNGISLVLPIERFLFVNTELSVHLARMPGDEWVCLDAVTRIGPNGIGLAQSTLWDRWGRLGSGNQALLVAPR